MNVLLFVFTILVSFIIVRIGAILFQLTGLDWSQSKFQALSCFSGTGFTTREAELIVTNTQRRRIASFLMVLGNAGLVTLIATFANSLNPNSLMSKLFLSLLPAQVSPSLSPWINLAVIVIILFCFYKLFTNTRFTSYLTEKLKGHIVSRQQANPVSFEELLVSTGGYGVSQAEVFASSPLANRTLSESTLRQQDILILAIERKGKSIPNPPPEMKILAGDKLVCFGKLGAIRKEVFSPAEG